MSSDMERELDRLKRSFEQIGVGMQKALDDAGKALNRLGVEASAVMEKARRQRQERDPRG